MFEASFVFSWRLARSQDVKKTRLSFYGTIPVLASRLGLWHFFCFFTLSPFGETSVGDATLYSQVSLPIALLHTKQFVFAKKEGIVKNTKVPQT